MLYAVSSSCLDQTKKFLPWMIHVSDWLIHLIVFFSEIEWPERLIFGVVSFEEATNTLATGQVVKPINNIKFAVN